MNYILVSIEANEDQQELLIGLLNDLDVTGFEQQDDRLLVYFKEDEFPSYDVQSILKDYNFQTNTLPEQNWNEEWEQNFKPVVVDDFCAVRAHFHKPVTNVVHEIIITPKMSFGTGHHATTYMMMQQMQALDFKNKSVFDFGTGTGILAILAEKCGAAHITAIDSDEWSYENALENVNRNHCNKITVNRSSILPDGIFDIILANINRNIILDYLPQLIKLTDDNTLILFSGLMKNDEEDITDAAGKFGFNPIKKSEKDNWICLLFSRGKSSLL